jgi:hypothetical protein
MPFGKHRGEPVSALPSDYLLWCLDKLTEMRPALKAAMFDELFRRRDAENRIAALSALLENTHGTRDPETWQERHDALDELRTLRGIST